ncbi:putative integral membrane protein [Thalassovita gelatinovora]|uniref:Putative integral membrane protein n=1 Tax=Thalassovita gelatinovora TaxID=53501 RepID=A0A0N7LUA8_THAGE|nr:anthrone oxygenase family protein [Thalassovita gelatinovora]QIZ79529.1 DUF1772 domain-containing protein [Thalassovita gelatinovora]CUH62978.1 putative integral membrane protein [Thalassovita gelatinovora]SEQ13432.1 Uncharacterized membrane protein [Thalassovita gelatinovora]
MSEDWIVWGIVALSLAAGLVAGIFLAFSDFIMTSLANSKPAAGTEAMQIINRKVYGSIFMVLLVGLVPVSVAMALLGHFYLPGSVAVWLIAGAVLYIVGVMLVTGVCNVPMNMRLEAMPQAGAAAQAYWPEYVKTWVLWNHLRTLASFGTMACYVIAAVQLAKAV